MWDPTASSPSPQKGPHEIIYHAVWSAIILNLIIIKRPKTRQEKSPPHGQQDSGLKFLPFLWNTMYPSRYSDFNTFKLSFYLQRSTTLWLDWWCSVCVCECFVGWKLLKLNPMLVPYFEQNSFGIVWRIELDWTFQLPTPILQFNNNNLHHFLQHKYL